MQTCVFDVLQFFEYCGIPLIRKTTSYLVDNPSLSISGYSVTTHTYSFPATSHWHNFCWQPYSIDFLYDDDNYFSYRFPSLSYPFACDLLEDNPAFLSRASTHLCCGLGDRPDDYEPVNKRISFIQSRLPSLDKMSIKELKAITDHFNISVWDRRNKVSHRKAIKSELTRCLNRRESNKKFIRYFHIFEELYPSHRQLSIFKLINEYL